MEDAEGVFGYFVANSFARAAGLPGGAMAAFIAHKAVRSAEAAAGWRSLSRLR